MKRESKKLSNNIIFYAPLSEGDLTDHISGNSFTGQNTTITFDQNEGMYKFYKSGLGAVVCRNLNLGLPFTNNSIDDVSCTITYDVKLTSNTVSQGYANVVSFAQGYYTNQLSWRCPSLCYNSVKNAGYNMQLGTLYHFATVFEKGAIRLYINGELTDWVTNKDNFDYTECNKAVSICAGNWSGNDGGGYYREICIFDKALNEREIRKVQNIE